MSPELKARLEQILQDVKPLPTGEEMHVLKIPHGLGNSEIHGEYLRKLDTMPGLSGAIGADGRMLQAFQKDHQIYGDKTDPIANLKKMLKDSKEN